MLGGVENIVRILSEYEADQFERRALEEVETAVILSKSEVVRISIREYLILVLKRLVWLKNSRIGSKKRYRIKLRSANPDDMHVRAFLVI